MRSATGPASLTWISSTIENSSFSRSASIRLIRPSPMTSTWMYSSSGVKPAKCVPGTGRAGPDEFAVLGSEDERPCARGAGDGRVLVIRGEVDHVRDVPLVLGLLECRDIDLVDQFERTLAVGAVDVAHVGTLVERPDLVVLGVLLALVVFVLVVGLLATARDGGGFGFAADTAREGDAADSYPTVQEPASSRVSRHGVSSHLRHV